MASRSAYDAVAASGEAEHLPDVTKLVWQAIERYYTTDVAAQSADAAIVAVYAGEGLSNPKHRDAIAERIDALEPPEGASAANAAELVRLVRKERLGLAVSQAVALRRPDAEVLPLMDEYREACAPAADESLAWAGILKRRLVDTPRVKLGIKSLTAKLGGGLLPGSNVTIVARPEVGKTAFMLSVAVAVARRGQTVVYLTNEDAGQALMVRAIQNITGADSRVLRDDPQGVEDAAIKLGIGNLHIYDVAPGSLAEIEKLVRRHNPALVCVDQMRNIRVAKAENNTTRLDAIAQGMRNVAKRHATCIIAATQAGDSGRDKAVLDDGDIDGSNTGIPAAADVLIGIGCTDTLRGAGMRTLSIMKNKLTGWHGTIDVRINESLSKVTSYD